MSYHTWHDYGFGICMDEIKIDSAERIHKLILKAPKLMREVAAWLCSCNIEDPTIEDYLEYDQDYNCGIAAILRDVILEKEHLEFYCCEDFDGKKYIMYQPCYPWQMKWRDRMMTRKKLKKILTKYLRILTDQPFELDFVESENGG